jgi:hypothetical protein
MMTLALAVSVQSSVQIVMSEKIGSRLDFGFHGIIMECLALVCRINFCASVSSVFIQFVSCLPTIHSSSQHRDIHAEVRILEVTASALLNRTEHVELS